MIVTETHLQELQPKSNFVPTGPWCQGQLISGFCEEKCDQPDAGAWGWCHWSRCLRIGCSARLLPRPTGRIGPWHSSLWQELESVTRSRWCVATSLLLSTCVSPVWHAVIYLLTCAAAVLFFFLHFLPLHSSPETTLAYHHAALPATPAAACLHSATRLRSSSAWSIGVNDYAPFQLSTTHQINLQTLPRVIICSTFSCSYQVLWPWTFPQQGNKLMKQSSLWLKKYKLIQFVSN